MNEAEQLQNAINLAVWHLEQGQHGAALSVLVRHYKESQEALSDAKEFACIESRRWRSEHGDLLDDV